MRSPSRFRALTLTLAAFALAGCMHGGGAVGSSGEATTLAGPAVTPEGEAPRQEQTAVSALTSESVSSVLVQGSDVATVAAAVRAVGGEVTHKLGIINAVGARLTPTQIRRLEASDDTLRIRANGSTSVSGMQEPTIGPAPESPAAEYTPVAEATYEVPSAEATADVPTDTTTINYGYRKKLSIDSALVSGNTDLTNMPVLVSFTDADLRHVGEPIPGKVEHANGFDIVFTDLVTTGTKLDHEIESYKASTGEIVMWARQG